MIYVILLGLSHIAVGLLGATYLPGRFPSLIQWLKNRLPGAV